MRKAFLSAIMELFDFLKLIVYSPLMMIKFPSNSMLLFDNLIEAVSYEMLYTDEWFPFVFNLPESSPLTERF